MAERISRGVVVPLTAVLICGSLLLAHPSWCQDDLPRPPETAGTEEAQAPSTDEPDEEPETEETEGETPDERQEADLPSSWGLNSSYARTLDDRLVPFVRIGWSDGSASLLEATVSSGIGMDLSRRSTRFRLSWGRPADSGLRDQYTAEIFYRLQVTAAFAVTPDVQVIFDPIFNMEEDSIVVFTLRAVCRSDAHPSEEGGFKESRCHRRVRTFCGRSRPCRPDLSIHNASPRLVASDALEPAHRALTAGPLE